MSDLAELQDVYALLQQRRLPEAEVAVRALLERRPRDPHGIHILGLIRKEAGDIAGAESLLRQSFELQPGNAEFRCNLANLLRRVGRLPDAEQLYRHAATIDPGNVPARYGLALTLRELGRANEAESACRSLLAANSHDARSWSLLAMCLACLLYTSPSPRDS